MVKNLPAMQETRVQSLGWEGSLEEGTATHSSTLAWRTPWTEGAWRATVHTVTKSWTRLKRLGTHTQSTRTYCGAQGALLNVMRQPGWEGMWGRVDPCVCLTESLTVHQKLSQYCFLIGYTPIQNKSLK